MMSSTDNNNVTITDDNPDPNDNDNPYPPIISKTTAEAILDEDTFATSLALPNLLVVKKETSESLPYSKNLSIDAQEWKQRASEWEKQESLRESVVPV